MIKSDKRYVLDLVSILGNALDNGIEACETMPEQSQGVITVQIGDDPLDYIIEITNTFTQSQIFTSEMLFLQAFLPGKVSIRETALRL